jgi:AraC-like DNA-binding protein
LVTINALVSEYLMSLAREQARLSPREWHVALESALRMINTALVPEEVVQASAREAQRTRALRYIEANLEDPRLSPRSIAVALKISLRYLHGLFEGTGQSVGATILAKRLERTRDLLTDPRYGRLNVSEIAFRCGFNEAAHFSRTFKARFGVRPTELRAR